MWLDASFTATFVTTFTSIFAIMNPIGCALIFAGMSAENTQAERAEFAWRIAVNSGLVLIASTWLGGTLMGPLGIGVPALRIAGGLVIAYQAWPVITGLPSPDAAASKIKLTATDSAFPLTMPFTTGPGTIATAIALGTDCPGDLSGAAPFILGTTAGSITIAASIAVLYGNIDKVTGYLDASKLDAILRLSAFSLLCIGIQVMMKGLRDALT